MLKSSCSIAGPNQTRCVMKNRLITLLLFIGLSSCLYQEESHLLIPATVNEASKRFEQKGYKMTGVVNESTLKTMFLNDSGYVAAETKTLFHYFQNRLEIEDVAFTGGRNPTEYINRPYHPVAICYAMYRLNISPGTIHYQRNITDSDELVRARVEFQSESSIPALSETMAEVLLRSYTNWPVYQLIEEQVAFATDQTYLKHSCGGNDSKIVATATWYPTLGKNGAYARAVIGCDD